MYYYILFNFKYRKSFILKTLMRKLYNQFKKYYKKLKKAKVKIILW